MSQKIDSSYIADTIDYYNINSDAYSKRTLVVDMQSTYDKFLPLLPKNASILDAGCGSGRDSAYFKTCGYQVIALDASIEMVKIAQVRINQSVLHKQFSEIDFVNEFDAIWSCASLLHLTKQDLPNVFNKFIKAMKIGGYWFISFKYGNEDTIEEGRLFSRFTSETFLKFIVDFKQLELINICQSTSGAADVQWLQIILRRIQ